VREKRAKSSAIMGREKMTDIVEDGHLTIPLYHGTSTIFIESILKHGLAGLNPIKEWDVISFARCVLSLCETHLSYSDLYQLRNASFRAMTEQKVNHFNWQHGDTYLSPADSTAIRYAVNSQYGSELLSYTIDFLKELLRMKVPGVRDDLYNKYTHIFNLIDVHSAPVLIKITDVPIQALSGENGSDPLEAINSIRKLYADQADIADTLVQQFNFRLTKAIHKKQINIWIINVTRYDPIFPEYKLYEIKID